MPISTVNKSLKLNDVVMNEDISKWMEQDIIVPDTKPDAVKIVNVTVTPYVNNVEVLQDKIKISGNVNYFVIYRVNDENFNTRGLFASYPYTEVLELKGVNSDMIATIKPICKNVIYSLPNERKISIKSEIVFKTKIKKIQDVELINKFDCETPIECKVCRNDFFNIIEDKKNIIASKEEFVLPKEAEDFYEILDVNTRIINTDYKESYNKVMVKGDIEINIIYLTENREDSVKKTSYNLPFSAMVELSNINDNSKFDISYIMQDFDLRLNQDITTTKTMCADYQIEVNVLMYEEEEVEYVEDFYSQTRELNFNVNEIDGIRKINTLEKNVNIKENVSNILPENTRVLDYRLDISHLNSSVNNNIVKIEGEAKVYLLLQELNSFEIESKIIDIIVDQNVDIGSSLENSKVLVDIEGENITVTQNGKDLDIRIDLEVEVKVLNLEKINVIENITDDDLDISGLDSINIYIVKPNDNLWKIAKKYKTSVEKIVKTNDILNPDEISVGQKILVIR